MAFPQHPIKKAVVKLQAVQVYLLLPAMHRVSDSFQSRKKDPFHFPSMHAVLPFPFPLFFLQVYGMAQPQQLQYLRLTGIPQAHLQSNDDLHHCVIHQTDNQYPDSASDPHRTAMYPLLSGHTSVQQVHVFPCI